MRPLTSAKRRRFSDWRQQVTVITESTVETSERTHARTTAWHVVVTPTCIIQRRSSICAADEQIRRRRPRRIAGPSANLHSVSIPPGPVRTTDPGLPAVRRRLTQTVASHTRRPIRQMVQESLALASMPRDDPPASSTANSTAAASSTAAAMRGKVGSEFET